ncbi:MAG TPA: hypothetical protein DDX19_27030 [Rhodopirellula baltica]|nr:hypothetical protein [Rhodopirellula baltica]
MSLPLLREGVAVTRNEIYSLGVRIVNPFPVIKVAENTAPNVRFATCPVWKRFQWPVKNLGFPQFFFASPSFRKPL